MFTIIWVQRIWSLIGLKSAAPVFAFVKDILVVSLGPHQADSIEACQNLSKAYAAMGRGKNIMEKLVSNWSNLKILPEDYVVPPDKRPGKDHLAPVCNTIPVIDLQKAEEGHHLKDTIQQILYASQEFGFFQVINHGVSQKLMDDTMKVCNEFFELPNEDKAELYSEDPRKRCRLHTSNNYASEEFHLWRDILKHPCHPLDEWVHLWPEKPSRYRDVVGAYSVQVRNLLLRILELISEGLGLELNFFEDHLTKEQLLAVNHYPPCPDPSLTIGLTKHCDPNIITAILQGDIAGLQVFKDGQWIGVEALPSALVINIGYQLQIITNDKIRSAAHRAVTNSSHARTSVVTLIYPDFDNIIEPAGVLVNNNNPPLYRAFQFREFLSSYIEESKKAGDTETALEPFKLSNP